jgi:hypothetical protein
MPYPWLFESLMPGQNYFIPAGRYYIGDIINVLKPDIYDESFNETGFKNGIYKCPDGLIILSEVSDTNGYEGVYTGSDDFDYVVSSGSIGIVSIKLIKDGKFHGGQIHNFPEGLNVIIDSGLFTFETENSVLHIDTTFDGPEDESEIEELCCNFIGARVTEMEVD